VETLRDRVLKAGDAAKGLLLEEAVKDEGGEMRRATLDLLRERVVPPEQGAWVALDLARALLQKAGAESSKKGKGGSKIKRSAEEAYEACVDVWEDVSDALLAAARLDPSRAGEAAHVFEEAIASAATSGEQFYLYFKLGHFYHETEAIEQAIATYRAAVELHDQLPARLKRRAFDGAHNNLGLLLDLCGRYAEAEAIYLSGIALSPRDGSMRKGLADTRMRLGRPLEALPEYRLAVKRLPSWLGAWTALVTCCRKLGLDAEAERALMKARKTANGSDASLVEKACLLAVEGDTESAIEALRDSIEADPSLRRVMRNDLDFESLWGDPRFLALVS
jgi:tetratricopeptide (TPR) repeat protein